MDEEKFRRHVAIELAAVQAMVIALARKQDQPKFLQEVTSLLNSASSGLDATTSRQALSLARTWMGVD